MFTSQQQTNREVLKLSLPMWTNTELTEEIADLNQHIKQLEADHSSEQTISYFKDKREILQNALAVRK
jgi:uncharacterized small protein (DUF1192 family)